MYSMQRVSFTNSSNLWYNLSKKAPKQKQPELSFWKYCLEIMVSMGSLQDEQ